MTQADGTSAASSNKRKRRVRFLTVRRLRDERGVTLIEFAIVAIPFFLLLFGTLELGFIYWGTHELENATEDAARLIRTGQAQGSPGLDETGFKAAVCSRVTLLFDCNSKLQVDVRSFTNFGQVAGNQATPLDSDGNLQSNFGFNTGGPRSIMLVNTFYTWPLFNPLTAATLSNMAGNNRLLVASAAFRNENF